MRTLLLLAIVLLAVSAQAQDVGLDATYGDISLDEGFLPDPHELEMTAGGEIKVDIAGCDFGWVAEAPDLQLTYTTSGESDLYIYAVSGSDTTLLINTAEGEWICDDDAFDDGDPLVVIPAAASGIYDIWVGTYNEEMDSATLFVSEIDPR